MGITVSPIYFKKYLPCSGLQRTDLRSPDAEVKSLSISLQVPVHVTIFSWKHLLPWAFTLNSGSLPASKRRKKKGKEQGQYDNPEGGGWYMQNSAEPGKETAERRKERKEEAVICFEKLTTPQIWPFSTSFNENNSVYSDNPFCNYSFSTLYYQEPKL